jgi:hypothetical protein
LPDDYFPSINQNVISEHFSEIFKPGDATELVFESKTHPFSFSKLNLNKAEKEYLSISTDIHSILSNYPNLPNDQKLDYCNSQRYFMKLYLKEVLIKINKK